MNLTILLPFQVFAQASDVTRIVADTSAGSFGILPRRLDCVAVLEPGILSYENAAQEEVFVALDEGILVKTGSDVFVSARRAHSGTDLAQLESKVEQEFEKTDQREQDVRSAMEKLETGFIRRFATFQHE